MDERISKFAIQWSRQEAPDIRLISLKGEETWDFIPGQVAVLGVEGVGESYFAIASAPEDKEGLEFLIRNKGTVAQVLFSAKEKTPVRAKGPWGRGFPIDQFKRRDLVLAGVGTAIAPLRGVINSLCHHRSDFGKVALLYGVRNSIEFCFLSEIERWRRQRIEVVQVVSRPEETHWQGKTGHVQDHFDEVLHRLSTPAALICGMKEMIEGSREKLVHFGVAAKDVLTNY